jgi:hypothetical protein
MATLQAAPPTTTTTDVPSTTPPVFAGEPDKPCVL